MGQSQRIYRETDKAANSAAKGAESQGLLPAGKAVFRQIPQARHQLLCW